MQYTYTNTGRKYIHAQKETENKDMTRLALWVAFVLLTAGAAADVAMGPVTASIHGFSIDSVWHDTTLGAWVSRVRYTPPDANTFAVLYTSKQSSPNFLSSFQISSHPCILSSQVCCLLDFAADYTVGTFATDIAAVLGTCGTTVLAQDTAALLDPAAFATAVDTTLDGLRNNQQSFVVRVDAANVDVQTSDADLTAFIADVTPSATGQTTDFFIGVAFVTVLPAPMLSTSLSQINIHIESTDTFVFSSVSQHDYTFVRHIALSLFDTKYFTPDFAEHHMQAARIGFVVQSGLAANPRTGLVPPGSIRYSIAQTLPEYNAPGAWASPCDAGWDPTLYDAAAAQACALGPALCADPAIAGGYAELWVPLGDAAITAAMTQSTQAYSVYIYFTVSVEVTTARPDMQGKGGGLTRGGRTQQRGGPCRRSCSCSRRSRTSR